MRDSSGRVVSILALLGDQRYNYVNIYAPTNPTERRNFFDSLPNYFFPNSIRIVAGHVPGALSLHFRCAFLTSRCAFLTSRCAFLTLHFPIQK